MTKPATVFAFDTNETNVLATLAGHITDGYADDEVPTAAEFNYMLNLMGEWIAYLNSGTYDGNLVVSGNLQVTGNTELDGNVTGTPNFTDAVTMTSTLGVTGLITATAGLTAAANQSITLSGTGRVKTGDQKLYCHIISGDIISSAASVSTAVPGVTISASGTAYFALRGVHSSYRIKNVIVYSTSSVNSTTYAIVVGSNIAASFNNFPLTGTAATAVASTDTVVITVPVPEAVADGYQLYLKVVLDAGSTRDFLSAIVTYDVV